MGEKRKEFVTTTLLQEVLPVSRISTLDDPRQVVDSLPLDMAKQVLLDRITELEGKIRILTGEKRRTWDRNQELIAENEALRTQIEENKKSLFINPRPSPTKETICPAFGKAEELEGPAWVRDKNGRALEFTSKTPEVEVFDLLNDPEQVEVRLLKKKYAPIDRRWAEEFGMCLDIETEDARNLLEALREGTLTRNEEIAVHNLFVDLSEETNFPVEVPDEFVPALKLFLQRCT